MAETTRVWVRTSTLDSVVYGKARSIAKRSIPGSSVSFDSANNDEIKNWGWAKCEVVYQEEGGNTSPRAVANTADSIQNDDSAGVQVLVKDRECAHHLKEVLLPNTVIADGNLVMANIYGHGGDDSDDEEEDDYYDDFGGNSGGAGNEDDDKYPNDLITLTHLHEPSVVYCLRKRYDRDKIYTNTGPILLAMNPFKNCKSLYSDSIMRKYWKRGEQRMQGAAGSAKASALGEIGENLPPHVYGTADHSFRTMMAKLDETQSQSSSNGGNSRRRSSASSSKGANQAILVSGESGAGKTVTTKFIMQYLATLSKRIAESGTKRRTSLSATGEKVDIEQQVLQSNPILESFGNARTIRNDNSSRFGKFIEIQFTNAGKLVGASIETYLLEKVRLISQAEGERNYHIFYEVLQGMDDEGLEKYFLQDYTAEDFTMTNQSGTYDRRDGVEDCETYQDLIHALDTMGFAPGEQENMFTIVSALLHASNLNFNSMTADECEIDRSNDHFEPMLSLLGVKADALNKALCYFSITAGRETHLRSLSKEKSEKGLLALIKATYGALFTFIVGRVNASIGSSTNSSSSKGKRGEQKANLHASSIGVLDIFGFESFRFNSFEQLCINYCNEALQQQFNLFVLKNEQEEYEREGIQWSFISFPDNQDVLDLIDKKGTGILNILDDQCRAPGTSDRTFANDIYQKLSRHPRFHADSRQIGARNFSVVHYAGTVEYSVDTFVEKNRDDLPRHATELLLSSSNKFVKHLAELLSGPAPSKADRPRGRSSANTKLTVGGQFSRQLQELRQKIDQTTPHYVRCLKPNDELVPEQFDPVIVSDQLRCAGVIEAVRVSRVGYSQRYTHLLFLSRYRILGVKALKQAARSSRRRKPVEVLVQAIASQIAAIDDPTLADEQSKSDPPDLVAVGIQVGKTKVFLRRNAFEKIEGLRNNAMRQAAIRIQATGRRHIVEREFRKAHGAIVTIQTCVRVVIAERRVEEKRRNQAAKLIQSNYRRFRAHRCYANILKVSRWLQKVQRGRQGRLRYNTLNRERKSIVIQTFWRSNIVRKLFQKKKCGAVTIQCAFRSWTARRTLRSLRIAARDLQNTAGERDRLRAETQELRAALTKALAEKGDKSLERDRIQKLELEMGSLKTEKDKMCKLKDSEKARADDAVFEISEMKKDLDTIQNQYSDVCKQKQEIDQLCSEKDDEIVSANKVIELQKTKLEKAVSETNDLSARENKNQSDLKLLQEEKEQLQLTLNEEKSKGSEEMKLLREKIHNQEEVLIEKGNKLEEANKMIGSLNAKIKNMSIPKKVEKADKQKDTDNASIAELKRLQIDNQDLQEEIAHLQNIQSTKDNETIKAGAEIELLKETVRKLKDENEILQENATKYQSLDIKASEEFDHLVGDGKNNNFKDDHSTSMYSLGTESESRSDKEIELLEGKIEKLKRELELANKNTEDMEDTEDLRAEIRQLKKDLVGSKENAAEEILTLQDEVGCLNRELSALKDRDRAPSNDAQVNINQDKQVGKLIDSIMAKDEEIRELRQEIEDLKYQVNSTHSYSPSIISGSLPPISQNHLFDDDTSVMTRSVVSKFMGQAPTVITTQSTQPHNDQDYIAVRKINEALRKEVEETRKECSKYKKLLRDEKERAAKELEAFGAALHGVDELRSAAESMSRELNRVKENEDNENIDQDESYFDSQEAAQRVQKANRKIDVSALKSERNIWKKMRTSLRSLSEEGNDVGDVSSNNDSMNRRRRRVRRKNDDASIFSSFF